MTATLLAFAPRKPKAKTSSPVSYRAEEEIEIEGLMIQASGITKDRNGIEVMLASLTDFDNNVVTVMPLVLEYPRREDHAPIAECLASGDAIAVRGYLECRGADRYLLVTGVSQMRKRNILKDAVVKTYIQHFEIECDAALMEA